jgi:FKBP-type peptidyl-prolyl cis-trans isomerase FkpA
MVSGLLTVSSCSKDDQFETDRERIEDFIAQNNLQAQSTSSGLYYVIDEPGSSEHPTLQDEITIAYTGSLLNGNIFDSSSSATFPLNVLIPGWKEGIPLFGKGGKGLLIIPSHLGYGSQVLSGIPANSVLVFDIHLIDF